MNSDIIKNIYKDIPHKIYGVLNKDKVLKALSFSFNSGIIKFYENNSIEILIPYKEKRDLKESIEEIVSIYYKALGHLDFKEEKLKFKTIKFYFKDFALTNLTISIVSNNNSIFRTSINKNSMSIYFSKPLIPFKRYIYFSIKAFFMLGKYYPYKENLTIYKSFNPISLKIIGSKEIKEWLLNKQNIRNFMKKKL